MKNRMGETNFVIEVGEMESNTFPQTKESIRSIDRSIDAAVNGMSYIIYNAIPCTLIIIEYIL